MLAELVDHVIGVDHPPTILSDGDRSLSGRLGEAVEASGTRIGRSVQW